MHRYLSPKCIFLTLICCAMLSACGNSTSQPAAGPVVKKAPAYDTLAVHLALMPTADCLPIFYAQETGIYRKLGLRLQIHTYASQLDCDTALLGGYMDGGYADTQRLEEGRGQKKNLSVVSEGTDSWQLFVGGSLRVKDVSKLAGRIVAISRESTEKSFCESLIAKTKLKADAVYLTQINDVKLRAHMMGNRQIDAAVLRWPFTALALGAGDKMLAAQTSPVHNNAFVTSATSKRARLDEASLTLLKKGYAMAIDSIRTYHKPKKAKSSEAHVDKASEILQKVYGIDTALADSIDIPVGGFFKKK